MIDGSGVHPFLANKKEMPNGVEGGVLYQALK